MRKLNGFTLIELLVVISIIGLLATTVAAALGTARAKARDAVRLANLERIQTAIDLYKNDKGTYPRGQAEVTHIVFTTALGFDPYPSIPVFGASCLDDSAVGFQLQADCLGNKYIENIPIDPSNPIAMCNRPYVTFPCGWFYVYVSSVDKYYINIFFETDNELTGVSGQWSIDQDRQLSNW